MGGSNVKLQHEGEGAGLDVPRAMPMQSTHAGRIKGRSQVAWREWTAALEAGDAMMKETDKIWAGYFRVVTRLWGA